MPRRNDVLVPVVAPVDLFPVTRYVIWISHLLHVSIQKAPRTASLTSHGRTPPPASADPAPVDVYPPAPEIPELVRPEFWAGQAAGSGKPVWKRTCGRVHPDILLTRAWAGASQLGATLPSTISTVRFRGDMESF